MIIREQSVLNLNLVKAQHLYLPGQKYYQRKKMKKTILLIDDDYLDVESVKRALKKLKADYDLFTAHNGVDGLAMLTGNVPGKSKIIPDIIILDIIM